MAYCPNAIGGIAWLRVDGEQYALRGDLVVRMGPTERTPVAGADGVHGYTEAYIAPEIEGTFSDIGGMSIQRLAAVCNATVTAELLNGKTYLLRNAWTGGNLELNAIEGSVAVVFAGKSAEEIMP